MEETVKRDIQKVLSATKKALDYPQTCSLELKEISDRTIHNSSIFQDEYSTSISILVYSLSKIIERVENRIDYKKIQNIISKAIKNLELNNLDNYKFFIKKLFKVIARSDVKFKNYVQEVVNQASVKKGSKIYSHGISASRTAEILGISPWEFYEYLGATSVSDADTDISSVRRRLEYTRTLFT